MDIDAIIAQLADNDEVARKAFRDANHRFSPVVPHVARHASREVYSLGRDTDGLAVYANGKSVL